MVLTQIHTVADKQTERGTINATFSCGKLNKDLQENQKHSQHLSGSHSHCHTRFHAEINLRCHSCSTKQASQNTVARCCIISSCLPVQSLTHSVQGHVFPRRLSQPLCASSVMLGRSFFPPQVYFIQKKKKTRGKLR